LIWTSPSIKLIRKFSREYENPYPGKKIRTEIRIKSFSVFIFAPPF
jgi:hypothetical protein